VDGRHTAARKILLLGYGNTLRGDDGVGQYVALSVASWNLPGLKVLAVHQLTTDLAEPLSKADLAIFVDAKTAGERDFVEVRSLKASNTPGTFDHTSDPQSLLALASVVFGRYPTAWLVSVPAVDFYQRVGLSATALHGAAEAIARVAALIDADDQFPNALSHEGFHRDRRAGEHNLG
jgi:hydrogenase maturation protease